MVVPSPYRDIQRLGGTIRPKRTEAERVADGDLPAGNVCGPGAATRPPPMDAAGTSRSSSRRTTRRR